MWILCAEIDDGSGTSIFIYWTGTGISFKKDKAKRYVKHEAVESRCRTINLKNGGGKVQVAGSEITVNFKIWEEDDAPTSKVRMCRVYGCTNDRCCINKKTGEHCSWVEEDLCSQCQEDIWGIK